MCVIVFVAKKVCQHGHIAEAEACWRHCFFYLENGDSAHAPKDNRTLCKPSGEGYYIPGYDTIKSSARVGVPCVQCRTCKLVKENLMFKWVEDSNLLAHRREALKGHEDELEYAMRQREEAVESGDQSSQEDHEAVMRRLAGVVSGDLGRLNSVRMPIEQMMESPEYKTLMYSVDTKLKQEVMASFDATTNQRQFIGEVEANEEGLSNFSEGSFDESLIVDLS